MGYQIDACLKDGKPSLKIWDSKKRSLCLSWTYRDTGDDKVSQQEIHRLFHKLLLLTLKDDLRNVRVFKARPERS